MAAEFEFRYVDGGVEVLARDLQGGQVALRPIGSVPGPPSQAKRAEYAALIDGYLQAKREQRLPGARPFSTTNRGETI